MSGDVRRCLELLRRAAEITEATSKQAAVPDASAASTSNRSQPSGAARSMQHRELCLVYRAHAAILHAHTQSFTARVMVKVTTNFLPCILLGRVCYAGWHNSDLY